MSRISPLMTPDDLLAVLSAFNPYVKGLAKTYTDEFVKAPQPVS
jgi:hypothetical protein